MTPTDPQARLVELIAKWRADLTSLPWRVQDAYKECANELASLLREGAAPPSTLSFLNELAAWLRLTPEARISNGISSDLYATRLEGVIQQMQAGASSPPELLAALKVAVKTIRTWHGIDMGALEAQSWLTYQALPEMTSINAAIAKAEAGAPPPPERPEDEERDKA